MTVILKHGWMLPGWAAWLAFALAAYGLISLLCDLVDVAFWLALYVPDLLRVLRAAHLALTRSWRRP